VVTYAAGPVRDFYLAASEDYVPITGQAGGTTVRFFTPMSLQRGASAGLEIAIHSIEDYSQRYALFPYREIDIVSTPTQALGIEYPGMVAITESIISPGDEYLEGVMAHEVAHQWFYNLVGNDQLDQPWLDESLAQFATLQYFTDQYGAPGEEGFRQTLEERWLRVNDAPIPIGKPVAAYTGQEYGAIVYGRGGLFFDALRVDMGAEKFDAFMKDYTATFSWDIATTAGLKSVAEKDCSCNLTPMFEAWVYP
jgi:aminopeptidase N